MTRCLHGEVWCGVHNLGSVLEALPTVDPAGRSCFSGSGGGGGGDGECDRQLEISRLVEKLARQACGSGLGTDDLAPPRVRDDQLRSVVEELPPRVAEVLTGEQLHGGRASSSISAALQQLDQAS